MTSAAVSTIGERLAGLGSGDRARWRSPIRLGLSGAGVAVLIVVFSGRTPGFDFYAYWAVEPTDPYAIVEGLGAFHYAPPLVWLAGPLRALPFEAAYVVWTVFMGGLLVWMTRSWALAWCAFPPVASELFHGNIHLLIAAALVLGSRYAVAWAVLPLTKVTTGIVAIWSLVRREWSSLAQAAAAIAVVAAASVLLQGSTIWAAWLEHLVARSGRPEVGGALIDVSLWVRLPLAALILAWGARVGRWWTLPIAVTLATPLLWFHSLSVLVALPALHRHKPRGFQLAVNVSTEDTR